MTAKEIFRKKDITGINKILKSRLGFKRLDNATFWEDAKTPYSPYKTELIIFSIHLLAYYSFDEWQRELIAKDKMMNELADAFDIVTEGPKIEINTLKEGMAFILNLPEVIKEQQFSGLMDDMADELRGNQKIQYSSTGYIEKAASKDMSKYIYRK